MIAYIVYAEDQTQYYPTGSYIVKVFDSYEKAKDFISKNSKEGWYIDNEIGAHSYLRLVIQEFEIE